MNNTQFRRLVLDAPTAAKSDGGGMGSTVPRGDATPALGSRMRSSIPMTPRSVAGFSGNDFARQLAERNAELNPTNANKFRASAAPKGTKLRAGFQDRTQLRKSGEEDDKAVRVKALEDMVKLGQMDQPTFEALRDEIVGGDVKDVHLVKGLDYKLLERVKRGEDVLSGRPEAAPPEKEKEQEEGPEVDVDDQFEKLEEQEIKPLAKEEKAKRGEIAPTPLAGKKRTRDEILRELKASRLAAAGKGKQSALGPRFMKVGQKRATSRIEKDERGREILITTDADGKVKRKVKKVKVDDDFASGHGLLMPDKDVKPLGIEVAQVAPPLIDEDVGDIFEGVGTDYNPLGDIADEDDSEESDGKRKAPLEAGHPNISPPPKPSTSEASNMAPPPIPPNKKRNWLDDSDAERDAVEDTPRNSLTEPAILAALRKASTINPIAQESTSEEEAARLARRKRMLESHDRDADDMDMEFGSSRFGDQEDGEDQQRVKLSVWGGEEDDEGGKAEGKGPRKRGAKKRKGDVNSAADVLKVMERRKGEGR